MRKRDTLGEVPLSCVMPVRMVPVDDARCMDDGACRDMVWSDTPSARFKNTPWANHMTCMRVVHVLQAPFWQA